MVFKVAVLEDKDTDASTLISYLQRFGAEQNIEVQTFRFSNGIDFLETNMDFHLVLMDIEMPLLNGLDTARKMRKIAETVPLIFITNMAQYAINGYEVEAMGFIVKPVKYDNLAAKLKKVLEIVKFNDVSVFINTEGDKLLINASDICYLEVINNYVFYHTVKGNYKVRTSLTEAEKPLLALNHFVRCNACYLVNLQYVTGVSGTTVNICGDKLTISRHKKKEFLNLLTVYMGKRR